MRRLKDDDTAAFEALYARHSSVVYGLAYRILGDGAGAEDVAQEAFLALWRNRHTYAPERGTPRGWLLTIAHNRAIDAIRRRRGHRLEPLEADFEQHEASERTEEEALRRADAVLVRDALGTLPDAQRHVLDLAYFAGLTQREIATQLSIPLGTVKGRMRLALRKLAQQLDHTSEAALAG